MTICDITMLGSASRLFLRQPARRRALKLVSPRKDWLRATLRSMSSQALPGQHGSLSLLVREDSHTLHVPLPGVPGVTSFEFKGASSLQEVARRVKERDHSVDRISFLDANGDPVSDATRLAELQAMGSLFVELNGFSFGIVAHNASAESQTDRSLLAKLEKEVLAATQQTMSFEEFVELCKDHGAHPNNAIAFLRALESKGLLLHFERSADPTVRSTIILNPQRSTECIMRALDVDGDALRAAAREKQAKVNELQERIKELMTIKAGADVSALRSMKVIAWGSLAYLTSQIGVLAYCVWDLYSWDVMEPFTYFLGMGVVWVSFFAFARSKEYPAYDALRVRFLKRRRAKLYAQRGYDPEEFEELRLTLRTVQQELNVLQARSQQSM